MRTLDEKVAIVTGSARGIGKSTAERLARAGARVAVNFATSADEARDVVSEIRSRGGSAIAVQADISNLEDVRRLFEVTQKSFGTPDIFVANAGYCVFKPLAETTEADFDRTFAVNAKGTFFCLQEAARRLNDGGRIVCISTIGTVLNLPGGSCYFGSKASIEQFCRVLAKEVAPRGISVNCVSPGFVETQMLADSLSEPGVEKELVDLTPLGRLGQPQDIAAVVSLLVEDDMRWVTRQNIPVDGGIVSR